METNLPDGASSVPDYLRGRNAFRETFNNTLLGLDAEEALKKIEDQCLADPVNLFDLRLDEPILFFSSLQHDICSANRISVIYAEEVPEKGDVNLTLSGHVFFQLKQEPVEGKNPVVLGDLLMTHSVPSFDDGHLKYGAVSGTYTFTVRQTYENIKDIVFYFLELLHLLEEEKKTAA